MRRTFKFMICAFALLLSAALLCGCTASVKLGGERFPEDAEAVSAAISAEELPKLDKFINLKSLDLSGSRCYDEIDAWAAAHPGVSVSYTLQMPDGSEVKNTASELDLSAVADAEIPAAAELITHMPSLSRIVLSSDISPEAVDALSAVCPDAEFSGSFRLMGKSISFNDESLSLAGINGSEAGILIKYLPHMPAVRTIDLGSDASGSLSWDDISAIRTAAPEAELEYAFTLYDLPFNLSDTVMNLNHIKMDDEGELVLKIAKCMKNLQGLDMDSCGVSNEAMAEIRDALPGVNVVWRIFFGEDYSVRTDVERILASNPGLGGDIMGNNGDALKYCTKVKYLDIGHNDYMTDISFTASMPDLEVLIIALSKVSDLSPLASCPKLEYLEIQLTSANDLSPLAGLKNLRHLNIGYCYALTDISPLFELPDLERVWIGRYVPVPPEQIEKLKETAPNCEVNTSMNEYENWRYTGQWKDGVLVLCPRYELLRQQMEYGNAPDSYAYYWNDPLY